MQDAQSSPAPISRALQLLAYPKWIKAHLDPSKRHTEE